MARKSNSSARAKTLDAAERAAGLVGADEFVNLLNDRWRFAWLNMKAGIMRGIGLTIGVALAIVILGYLVTVLGGIPIIGDFISAVNESAQQTTTK